VQAVQTMRAAAYVGHCVGVRRRWWTAAAICTELLPDPILRGLDLLARAPLTLS
jgi:hypothetical protein